MKGRVHSMGKYRDTSVNIGSTGIRMVVEWNRGLWGNDRAS